MGDATEQRKVTTDAPLSITVTFDVNGRCSLTLAQPGERVTKASVTKNGSYVLIVVADCPSSSQVAVDDDSDVVIVEPDGGYAASRVAVGG